jgi:2-oxoglutarate ferredoxin oxidoreductase subunit beta
VKQIFARPAVLHARPTHYCPGCTHGVAHRLVAEVIDELGIRGRTIGVASVGCAVFIYDYRDVDFQEAPHGRAPAVATGIKRVLPDRVVFTYQGDGDLAAIGTAEIIHAANRGERITVIFLNNVVYGMTGGQMAPTTLLGMRTTTTPAGRSAAEAGFPLRVAELLAPLPGVAMSPARRCPPRRTSTRRSRASAVPSRRSWRAVGSRSSSCCRPVRSAGTSRRSRRCAGWRRR